MSKKLSNFILILSVGLMLNNCANRGTPTGGDKDVTPPVITKSEPENYTTNFDTKEIKIYFDEYIKINDLQKQLIISPPMDPEPEITPLGSASKYITIKIHDTLLANTTYAFNFGESIVDNNEGNPYPYYRYVFSTGDYIDSLSVNGYIDDALKRVPEDFVSVMLYDIDSTFTDSIVYQQKPKYITNTLDSTTTFKLENLKAGQYLMVALKEENGNFTFQQKTDKIGFYEEFISVPTDSGAAYGITLFKEEIDFRATRPSLISGNKIAFGYEGNAENMTIELLSEVSADYTSIITKDAENDSLNYWYQPKIDVDSLIFKVSNTNYLDTLTVKIKDQLKDSLSLNPVETRVLRVTEDFEMEANIPFVSIDESQIKIIDKDSANVVFTTELEKFKNRYKFSFNKTEENNYKIQMLPGAFTDLFGNKSDSLDYTVRTKSFSDYGNLRVTLRNAVYPMIVQLVNAQGEVVEEKYTTKPESLDFIHLDAGKLYLRAIFDTNGNRKYDSGNYLLKRQPERVSYASDIEPIRAGWDEIMEFILK
jgi:uncharacterized protein (DUF2141 family)